MGNPLVLGAPGDRSASSLSFAQQQDEVLVNAGYIFIALVLTAFVTGGLAFGMREYMLSFRKKPHSAGNLEWGAEDPVPRHVRASVSLPAPGAQMHEIVSEDKPLGLSLPPSLFLEGDNTRLAVVYDELWLPGLAGAVLEEKVAEERQSQKARVRQSKVVYTPERAFDIGDRVRHVMLAQNDVSRLKKRPVRLSRLFRYSAVLPHQAFSTVWQAEKAFTQVRETLAQAEKGTDAATISVSILRMVSFGVSYVPLDNPNCFLRIFNELVEGLVDNGVLFSLLENDKLADPLYRMAVSDMVLVYCWLHWIFKSHPRRAHIQQQFADWNASEPVVQSHATIFRLLCNILLGLNTLADPTRGPHEFRVQVLFREIAKSTQCYDHLALVPVVVEAIGLASTDYLKALFYDVLHMVVRTHGGCCMADYIGESVPLRTVVQRGLRQRGGTVGKRAKVLFEELKVRCPSLGDWLQVARREHGMGRK